MPKVEVKVDQHAQQVIRLLLTVDSSSSHQSTKSKAKAVNGVVWCDEE